MAAQPSLIHQLIQTAIDNGTTPDVDELRRLRRQSEKQVKTFKTSFWVAIAIINIMIWVPFPFRIPLPLMVVVGLGCAGFAFSAPILVIRKHQRCLEALKIVGQGPKRRSASDTGQKYIDRVKQEGRSFIQAEVELLEGSRYDS